jgi:hypothetical protein
MREIEMALDTLEHIAGQVRIAVPMFDQFPFLRSVNIMRDEECLGQIERCDDFVEGVRFVLNPNYFEVRYVV